MESFTILQEDLLLSNLYLFGIMNEQWHLAVNRKQSGPHSREELKTILQSINLDGSDVKVWLPSMPEWVHPASVDGLLSSDSPLPIPSSDGVESSEFNPYAPPQTVAALEEPLAELGNHRFEVMKCLSVGWAITKANLGQLLLFLVVMIGISIFVALPFEIAIAVLGGEFTSQEPLVQDGPAAILTVVSGLVQQLVGVFLGLGAIRFQLNHLRRSTPAISDLFTGGPHFLNAVIAYILFALAVVIGLVLLIIPGIYIMIRLAPHQILVVDRRMGPIEALKASWSITQGNVLSLIGLGGMGLLIVLGGTLALLVGLIWAIPTVYLAWVAAYHTMAYGEASLSQHEG